MTGKNDVIPALAQTPRDDNGPVFKEPWEAAVFALAVRLSEEGRFSWSEWGEALSLEIAEMQNQGDSDLGDTYYHHWVNALERLCASVGLVTYSSMTQRKDDWRRAYLNTPHGEPVELSAACANGSGLK